MNGARQPVSHQVNRAGQDHLGNNRRESGARDDRREKQERVHEMVIGGARLIQQSCHEGTGVPGGLCHGRVVPGRVVL